MMRKLYASLNACKLNCKPVILLKPGTTGKENDMRITSAGQIPLPPEVINQLGFLPDTEIEYQIEGETLLLRKSKPRKKGKNLVSLIKGTSKTGLTTDQIMVLTRGE